MAGKQAAATGALDLSVLEAQLQRMLDDRVATITATDPTCVQLRGALYGLRGESTPARPPVRPKAQGPRPTKTPRTGRPRSADSVGSRILKALGDGPLKMAALASQLGEPESTIRNALADLRAGQKAHTRGKSRATVWVLGVASPAPKPRGRL